ncbi:MAG: cytochrome c [Phycisphaerales bacterium]
MRKLVFVVVSVVAAIVVFNLIRAVRSRPVEPIARDPGSVAPSNQLREVQASPQYARGQKLFQGVCTLCHMEQGEGQPGMVPPLHGAPIATGDGGAFVRILLHGMEGPVEVKGTRYEGIMPPATFSSDEDLAAVMTFVRNSWGNAAGPVSPEDVAKVKGQTVGRTRSWTASELRALGGE